MTDILDKAAQAYAMGCRYKVGDRVTPIVGHALKGTGAPHVVLEVFPEPIRPSQLQPLQSIDRRAGARLDMRVIAMRDGVATPFLAESWQFDPYPAEASAEAA